MHNIFGSNLVAIFLFSSLCFAACAKKTPREAAASPQELLQKISDPIIKKDHCRLLNYLTPKDRALFVATEVFSLEMLINMNHTLGNMVESTVGFAQNLTNTAERNGSVDSAEKKKAKEQIHSVIEDKTSSNRLKSDLKAALEKHGLKSRTFLSIAKMDSENFRKVSDDMANNFEGVNLIAFCEEIETLAAQSGVERKQQFSVGPFDLNTIEILKNIAKVRVMDEKKENTDTITMKKVSGRWYISLKETVMDAQNVALSEERVVDNADVKKTEHPSLKALKKSLKGYWKGKNGTLKFNEDGTAVFDIKSLKRSGKLVIEDFELGLVEEDGSTNLYSAYLDSQNNLHVGVTDNVGALGQDRKGRVPVDMFRHIEIGHKCYLVDNSFSKSKTPIKCGFMRKNGDQVFQFEIPDTFDSTKKEVKMLVYLEKERLLVPSELRDFVYIRKND